MGNLYLFAYIRPISAKNPCILTSYTVLYSGLCMHINVRILEMKGDYSMKKTRWITFTRSALVLALAAVILFCAIYAPQAQASNYQASYIEPLSQKLDVNYKDYLDSNIVYQLPAGMREDQEISVIISLDVADIMSAYENTDKSVDFTDYALYSEDAANIEAQIAERKAEILADLDKKGVAYKTGKDYSTILSGFEILVKAGDFAATCKSLNKGENAIIGEVYKAAETELVENTVNVFETGIFNSGDSGYDGSGMVVAVLDTGLDTNHTAFSVDNFTSDNLGLTYEDVAKVMDSTKANALSGATVDDVYVNKKVPFAYDYADSDPDAYSTHNNHGTHVSGVIVGKDDVITGVAPNAQVVAMKVFSDVVDTAMASWILDALEDCVILGVDAINMSLGTAAGFSRESDEELVYGVYDKIRNAGISLIVAASNSYSSAYGSEANGNLGLTSNPDTGTVGSPGTYPGTISVASISGKKTPYLLYDGTIIYFDEANNNAAKELSFFDTLLGDADSKTYEYVVIPGVGRSADYTGMDVTGKIALVRRGDNTFEEKAMIAQSQGAAGIIIYNNVSGDVKMNVGDASLAVCSISQNDGEFLAEKNGGKLTIKKSQTSGPFISDFSSWGPTPDLKIKPEITAHGGNIYSSITGGGYDYLSGTSMACPNLAGVVLLLRQYVVENFPDIANDNVAVNKMVNKLMMSTADIILNTNGLPYAIRKQGAGLANLASCLNTKTYITTYDKDGKEMDTTKLELGDDPDKTGVYEMKFTVTNFGNKNVSYDIGAYVLTEGVSETKTNAGETTVTEEAYVLDGASVSVSADESEGGSLKKNKLTVKSGSSMDVTVTVTLTDENKAYLDSSFANGMYVEGFVTLTADKGTDIDLNVPYLAFYGDWTQAPLFDLTYYETNADELDMGLDEEDKLKADAYATRLVGGMEEDYVSYLGSYYFLQDPEDMVISATKDYIALSNQVGTIHSLRYMWTGLLRNAAKVDVVITDDTTGETVFEVEDVDVRKSYGDGGSIYPANVEIEFDTMDYNLANNSKYTVTVTGQLDYGDGGVANNEKNTYSFPLTYDIEAPTVTDIEFYYEYDKTLKKNRLYAKAAIYDNHHAMSAQLGYVTMGEDENGNPMQEMKAFEQYMTPIYSQENSTTYVTFELTDYLYDIKANSYNDNSFVVTVYDYALNYATYEIGLPADYVDFYLDGLAEGLTMSVNEVYSLEPLVYPETGWSELLEFSSSRTSIVRVVNNKLVAVSDGTAVVKVRDPKTNKSQTFTVTVLGEGDEGYRRYDKPVADVFRLNGYVTQKAYYMLASEDKLLGNTGDTRFFEGKYNLSMYPSESVLLKYDLAAYFPNDTTVTFETSNENIVKVDSNGIVTAVAEGYASVTVKVMMDGKSTFYSESVSVDVKDPYVSAGGSLTHYYGNGGVVTIPEDLSLKEIGNFAFSNFDYVAKTPEELAIDDRETTKQWYIGEGTITKVVIPEGVEKIGAYAFANLTALEEVVLPSTLQAIEYGAFYGCSKLETITFSGENNLQIINQSAFEQCDLKGTVDLSAVCIVSNYAFAGNKNLKEVTTGDSLLSVGQYAFAGCEKLETMTITAKKVKYGSYAYTGCDALKSFYVNAAVLPEGMFYECKELKEVTIGADVNSIGAFAFRDTKISKFVVEKGNAAYQAGEEKYILSADGKTLAAVAPTITGAFTAKDIGGAEVTAIGLGAFSHNVEITSVELPAVTVLGNYAFGSSKEINSVKLGELTSIGEYAFFETAITELPKFTAETYIGKYAFSFTDITSVTIPDKMEINEGVFSECLKLQTVVIGNDVVIGKYAFTTNKDNVFTVVPYLDTEYYCYEFSGTLTSLTIGDNAVIGENAFSYAAALEAVTLGQNAEIGKMAFYNAVSLKQIDLSKAKSIGDYAFSGDVYMVCMDTEMGYGAVSSDGYYIYSYYAPMLETVNLSAATAIGEYAFAYCKNLQKVTLGEGITEILTYTFTGCDSLTDINLNKITKIADYAFSESVSLAKVDLSAATSIGEYAFVNGKALQTVILNPEGCELEEGAFCYNEKLVKVENMGAATKIGDYAFAYTALKEADLTGAISVGNLAFVKETAAPFKVTLGSALETLGDNPFAMCQIKPFQLVETNNFNGVDYTNTNDTYQVSDNVQVIDGSLYCKVPNGLELITYAGTDHINVHLAEDTVRITSMAFAGTDIEMVTMPFYTTSIGHKAFYNCNKLHTVVFGSQVAPILEEEFDPAYYDSLKNIPGSGDYGTYTDYDGNEVQIDSMGMIPYFMWNATSGMYSNVFYGANFVDYVGYVEDKLTMVRPANGVNYDSYVMNQYFDLVIDGERAPDKTTLAAIAAIKAIPSGVTYENRALVETARAAYDKVATHEQKALVLNYSDLVSAEQRILALTPTEEPVEVTEPEEKSGISGGLIAVIVIVAIAVVGGGVVLVMKKMGANAPIEAETEDTLPEELPQEEVPEEESIEAEAEAEPVDEETSEE